MAKEKVISFDNLKEYDQKMKKWVENKVDKKNNENKIPKNLSDLKNDCGFVTEKEVEKIIETYTKKTKNATFNDVASDEEIENILKE